MVQRNLSWGDATFRGLFGLVLAILGMDALIFFDGPGGVLSATVMFLFAVVLIVTAMTGFCPVYRAFGRRQVRQDTGWDH